MKKFKSYKVLCLVLGLGVVMSSTVLHAANVTKTIKAIYSNIAISYNGQTKFLSSEPFIVDGTTYVPLRAVSEVMGANVSWANNTVYITQQDTASVSAQQEIASKNFEIASLKQQLELAQKELETFKGTGVAGSNLTTAAIASTLSTIKSTYSDDFNIEWSFNLKQSSSRLDLSVSYDSRYDATRFNNISESKRKQFIKDICQEIANLHKDVEIRGTLEDSRTSKEIASFRYTRTGSYTYEEQTYYSLSSFAKELEDDYTVINQIGFSIPIKYIELSERNNTLTFTITTDLRPNNNDYRSQWNNLTLANKRDLEDFLARIKKDIEREYSSYDDIVGIIRDNATGNIIANYESNGRLYLNNVNAN